MNRISILKITVGFFAIVGIILLLVLVTEETSGETITVAKDGNGVVSLAN